MVSCPNCSLKSADHVGERESEEVDFQPEQRLSSWQLPVIVVMAARHDTSISLPPHRSDGSGADADDEDA